MSESLGKIFKEARREKNLSIGEVVKRTKISHSIISNIEEDNFDVLSPVYIKSFLKMYAKFLGLDEQDILSRYYAYTKSEQPRAVRETVKKKSEPEVEVKSIDSVNPLKKIFSNLFKPKTALILLAVIIIAFVFLKKDKAIQKPLPEASQQEISETVAPAKPLSSLKKGDLLTLAVRAKADCWMRVKVDGDTIFQNTLKKGGSETWQAQESIEIRVGNPSAIDMELNGEVLEQFGSRSSRVRQITITRQGITVDR